MTFQDWASLELVRQTDHYLLEDGVPGFVLCFAFFVRSFIQQHACHNQLLAGSWE